MWEASDYHWYAERYGWTPSQVDDLPAQLAEDLRLVARAIDQGHADAQEKADREAERASRRGR